MENKDLFNFERFENYFILNQPNKVNYYISYFGLPLSLKQFKDYLYDLYYNLGVFTWKDLLDLFDVYDNCHYRIYLQDLKHSKHWLKFLDYMILNFNISDALLCELIDRTLIDDDELYEKYINKILENRIY